MGYELYGEYCGLCHAVYDLTDAESASGDGVGEGGDGNDGAHCARRRSRDGCRCRASGY